MLRAGGATLPELVAVAGASWAVEDCFAEAKNETGLDHYQVRLYRAWYRHVTWSMLAHAFLAVTARALRRRPVPPEPPPGARSATRLWKRGTGTCGRVFAETGQSQSDGPVAALAFIYSANPRTRQAAGWGDSLAPSRELL